MQVLVKLWLYPGYLWGASLHLFKTVSLAYQGVQSNGMTDEERVSLWYVTIAGHAQFLMLKQRVNPPSSWIHQII